jgi:hypothetical protein
MRAWHRGADACAQTAARTAGASGARREERLLAVFTIRLLLDLVNALASGTWAVQDRG